MVFCNNITYLDYKAQKTVTILILIDGFLQFYQIKGIKKLLKGHNPYFNRWFSAMEIDIMAIKQVTCHNPYFNRWFSAMQMDSSIKR